MSISDNLDPFFEGYLHGVEGERHVSPFLFSERTGQQRMRDFDPDYTLFDDQDLAQLTAAYKEAKKTLGDEARSPDTELLSCAEQYENPAARFLLGLFAGSETADYTSSWFRVIGRDFEVTDRRDYFKGERLHWDFVPANGRRVDPLNARLSWASVDGPILHIERILATVRAHRQLGIDPTAL